MNTYTKQSGLAIKALLLVIAVVALAGGVLVYSMKKSAPQTPEAVVPTPEVTPTAMVKDTSDTAIDKKTAEEEDKLNELDKDSKNIDQGLNDKQGDLSE